jgi:hypothetical protein
VQEFMAQLRKALDFTTKGRTRDHIRKLADLPEVKIP